MRLNKPYTNAQYADLAVYCNKNGMIIEDKGDCLEAVNPPEPSIEDKQVQVRAVRNQYLKQTDEFMITDYPITDDERGLYRQYRVYLRDYTLPENWWESEPQKFEEWVSSISDVQ